MSTQHKLHPYIAPTAVPLSENDLGFALATILVTMNEGLEGSSYRYVIDNTGQVRLLLNPFQNLHDTDQALSFNSTQYKAKTKERPLKNDLR